MPDLQTSLTYYDLKLFGFYRIRQGGVTDYIDGSVSEIMTFLISWLMGKSFQNTIPWGSDTNLRRSKVYCRSYKKDPITGDIFLVLWKSVGDKTGEVHGTLGNSHVGGDTNEHLSAGTVVDGEEIIWGQPSYYWIIPSEKKVAALRIAGSIVDSDSLCHFIKAFVDFRYQSTKKKFSEREFTHPKSHRLVTVKTATFEYLDEKEKPYHASFKIQTRLHKKSSQGLNFEQVAQNITQLVYRDTLSASVADTRPGWIKMFDVLGTAYGNETPQTTEDRFVEVVVDARPTAEELAALVLRHAESHDENAVWNNLGFKTGGRSDKTTWLDEFVVKDEISIPMSNNAVYTADNISIAINAHRERLLTNIRDTTAGRSESSQISEITEAPISTAVA